MCDLLSAARGSPQRILPSLPAIVRAIRVAISCKNPELLVFVCTALRELATGNKEVWKYRRSRNLSVVLFVWCRANCGWEIDENHVALHGRVFLGAGKNYALTKVRPQMHYSGDFIRLSAEKGQYERLT